MRFPKLLGTSPAFDEVRSKAERVAASNVPVLLLGESGTGKELIAQSIHAASSRAKEPFVAVNLAALPATLIEDELFGHAAGAFTGATSARAGRFRRAHGGTLFLDEIGDVSPQVQVKLLRVLEEGTIEPLGSEKSESVDVRIIAATHRDLTALAKSGRFRPDLMFRLAVVPIALPPLRERGGDVAELARHFASRPAESFPAKKLDDATIAKLETHSWPGNVRELENAVMRARVLATNEVLMPDDFAFLDEPKTERAAEIARSVLRAGVVLPELERAVLEEALRVARGNDAEAARRLGISRRALEYRLDREKEA